MNSIIQDKKECYVCKTTIGLHKHHIFEGRNRKNSEKYGCWCWLCPKHHNMSDEGVHFNKRFDNYLKRYTQRVFEVIYNEEFINIFRRNYK